MSPKKGDILFIRTGVIPEWNTFSDQRKQEYAAQKTPEHAGVEANIEVLEWLWDSGISAVAGDAISWEVSPTPSLPIFKKIKKAHGTITGISNPRRSLDS